MLSFNDIYSLLKEQDPQSLTALWQEADSLRQANVGNAVHFRGLLELSNYCRRNCLYCGIRAGHQGIARYRMTEDEILDGARLAASFGYGTVVLQAGEDSVLTGDVIANIVKNIKSQWGLAVTLSLGERTEEEWAQWREAGADRYLLRFETSNQRLFNAIHPDFAGKKSKGTRIDMLKTLRRLGYEIGSGVMIGIPGQSYTDLANDLLLFRELDLDMIGCGPYLPHPATPLGTLSSNADTDADREKREQYGLPSTDDQVANSIEMGYKVIALTRLLCPESNIPSTTAIATMDGEHGRVNGLSRGANVIMPNLTPQKYRALYEIYPGKAATLEDAEQTHRTALEQVSAAGRIPGTGPGRRKRNG